MHRASLSSQSIFVLMLLTFGFMLIYVYVYIYIKILDTYIDRWHEPKFHGKEDDLFGPKFYPKS